MIDDLNHSCEDNIAHAFSGGLRWIDCVVNLCEEDSGNQSWEVVFDDGKKIVIESLQDAADFFSTCKRVEQDKVNPRRLIARCAYEYYEGAE
ncbi:hypothetical protein HQ563_03295 [bacterium]|nr:hypothetical protein [bacterium]